VKVGNGVGVLTGVLVAVGTAVLVGVGEGIDDLAAFTARDFAQAIAGIES
jgi:signal recognition particle GTPase